MLRHRMYKKLLVGFMSLCLIGCQRNVLLRNPSDSKIPNKETVSIAMMLTSAPITVTGAHLLLSSVEEERKARQLNVNISSSGGYCLKPNETFALKCQLLHATTRSATQLHNVGLGLFVTGSLTAIGGGIGFLWPEIPKSNF